MVTQLKLTDFWNEPPQRGKKEGQEETYNTCVEAGYNNNVRYSTCRDRQRRTGKKIVKATNGVETPESISQMINLTKPMMSPMMSLLLRITGLEVRLETLDKDVRELRTYLFGGFVLTLIVSLLLKLLGLM
jgi:hypothetical protein